MSRSSDMIVNNSYHNIACKSSDIKKSKNKNGFLGEQEDNNNEKSFGFISKSKKSFAQSITESPIPSLSIIETHFEERTRNGSLPLRDLYIRKENSKNENEKDNLSRQDVSKKSKVKSECKYEEEEQESSGDLKIKNGFRSSFKQKYFNGFNRSKRKSKKAAKKDKLVELPDSDVSLSAAESEPPIDDISCDLEVLEHIGDPFCEKGSNHPERSNSFSANGNQNVERKLSENSIRANLEYLRWGNFNKDILNIVKKYRRTNVTDLLKCKCLEKKLSDFHKFINDLEEDTNMDYCKTTHKECIEKPNNIVRPVESKTKDNKISQDKSSVTIENEVSVLGSINNNQPSKSEQETISGYVQNDLIDTTSLKVKDVIQLFESAAQKSIKDDLNTWKKEISTNNRNKYEEKSSKDIITEKNDKNPNEITNKLIVDKKTFFQRLSSWPLLKPRNKVVRRATPMKTLNQLRQHLTTHESDIDSIADSEKDAEEDDADDESDVTSESIDTQDREDCESNVSQTSVTYYQKVKLRSFDHIIQEIDNNIQVSLYWFSLLFYILYFIIIQKD